MDSIILKRLELIGGKVREGLMACREILLDTQTEIKRDCVEKQKLRASVDRLNREIQNVLAMDREATEKLSTEIESLTTLQLEADELLIELNTVDPTRKDNDTGNGVPQTQSFLNSRLPKLEMIKFDGNILRFHQFWDRFTSAIENRTDMSDVEKMTYLLSLVEGEAKRAVEGLDITNQNYKVAVVRLVERFGKKGVIIDAHYVALQNLPKSSTDVTDCRRTIDDIERHLQTLHSLGEDTNHRQLRATILEKFSEETIFDLRMAMSSDDHSVQEIRILLEKVISAREAALRMATIRSSDKGNPEAHPMYTIETLFAGSSGKREPPSKRNNRQWSLRHQPGKSTFKNSRYLNPKRSAQTPRHFAENQPRRPSIFKKRGKLNCVFCSGPHIHERCDRFKTIAERKVQLKQKCFLCLRDSHFLSECPYSQIKCVHCGKQGVHNRSLCPKVENRAEQTHTQFSNISADTVLQTASVSLCNPEGRVIKGRVLFDTGSQKTYIRSSVAKQLKLELTNPTTLSIHTFSAIKPKTVDTNIVTLDIQTSESLISIQAYTLPTLTGDIPSFRQLKMALQKKYPALEIAIDVSVDSGIDLIIGNDYYHSIVKGDKMNVTPTLFLIKSTVGWIPSGQITEAQTPQNDLTILTYVQDRISEPSKRKFIYPDPAIKDDNIKDIWELETIGIRDSPKLLQDEQVVQYFNETTKFNENRYHVRWPWIQYPPELPVNLGLALGRLKSLIKRLDPETLQNYNSVLQDQLKKGIIETIREPTLPESHPVHYLPHHCVVSPQKTTKLRIVYDASSKSKGQNSLNDLLYKGPLLLEDLTSLLIKFRQWPIAIVADIEKAFLQVGLQEQDRDVTRFLWIHTPTQDPSGDNLIHLRFCRVPFGVISSPFLLAATIRRHFNQKGLPLTNKIAASLYVDNLVTGVVDQREAERLFSTSRDNFAELSMNIREWSSNCKEFLTSIPREFKNEERFTTVLGLKWDTQLDVLSFKIQLDNIEQPVSTKRHILRVVASVFDPCGFTAPLTLPTRLFLQDLWDEKMKWDTPLLSHHLQRWEFCKTFLRQIPMVSVPRFHLKHPSISDCTYELHCFTDASKDAYICVVYIRASDHHKNTTGFMISKSRLTPLKRKASLTIPKLELLAVVIGKRLLQYAQRVSALPIQAQFLWTDSQVVLAWLRSKRLLPPFVAKRVAEIHGEGGVHFRYIDSASNPADVATRVQKGPELPDLWRYGPLFLTLPQSQWPHQEIQLHDDLSTPDDNATVVMEVTTPCGLPSNQTETSLPVKGIQLDPAVISQAQREFYPDEISGKRTPVAQSLGLYMDEIGLLRCKGRFAHAEFLEDQKYPILLPKLSPITAEVIRRLHETNHHVGVAHTLSILRKLYWVPQGRALVSRILYKCPKCVKYGGGPYRLPTMPDLPSERVTFSAPFTNVGLDYFGPLITLTDGVRQKRWGCIFTCMAVRAMHIELIDDQTTEEFLLAFRRFAATRGLPKLIVSDNAANFRLASTLLDNPQNGVHWKFIPALSPWFGGFYERLIGMVKNCLRRTLDQCLLTDNQLRTVFHEIAATLNTRPLTMVTGEQDTVITPSHFLSLNGSPVIHPTQLPTLPNSSIRDQVVTGWKRTKTVLDQFRNMFQSHYLTSLRERHTLLHKQPRIVSPKNPKVGDKVQIKGGHPNRVHWEVGTISSILSSTDGAIRTARVTLPNGHVLNRSIGHLYPLEMELPDPTQSDSQDTEIREPSPSTGTEASDAPTEQNPLDTPQAQVPCQQSPAAEIPAITETAISPTVDQPNPAPNNLTDTGDSPTLPRRASARQAIQRIRAWTRALFIKSIDPSTSN